MFNIYVVLDGHDMVTDASRLPRAGAKSKHHNYKQKWQKMKDFPKKWVSTSKPFEDLRRKKNF